MNRFRKSWWKLGWKCWIKLCLNEIYSSYSVFILNYLHAKRLFKYLNCGDMIIWIANKGILFWRDYFIKENKTIIFEKYTFRRLLSSYIFILNNIKFNIIFNIAVPFYTGSIWLASLMILNSPNNNTSNRIIIIISITNLGWIINIVFFFSNWKKHFIFVFNFV